MHVRVNDAGHDVAGGEHHRFRLDLAAVVEPDGDCPSGRIERCGLTIEETRTTRHGNAQQATRELQRIGIGSAGRYQGAGAQNGKGVVQPGMIEKFAGQSGATAKLMLRQQEVASLPAAR